MSTQCSCTTSQDLLGLCDLVNCAVVINLILTTEYVLPIDSGAVLTQRIADAYSHLASETKGRSKDKILKAIETFCDTDISIPIDVVKPIDTTQPHSSASLTAVNSRINISMENGIVAANLEKSMPKSVRWTKIDFSRIQVRCNNTVECEPVLNELYFEYHAPKT